MADDTEPAGSLPAKVLISVAARLTGMHPQTLRQYDRLGLVQPGRTAGGGRRYSGRDIELLREIQRLSQEEGVSLAGIKRIIELEQLADELRQQVAGLQVELATVRAQLAGIQALGLPAGTDLLPARTMQSVLAVWRPRRAADGS
jgi:MerR family transcriptional regulator, heat shock protein HspR